MSLVDWNSAESHLFLNPRLPPLDQLRCEAAFKHLKEDLVGHIVLSTSGSINQQLIALSKNAFLASAEAVNEHFSVTASDIWLNPLPTFHVGGLAIYARAALANCQVKVLNGSWLAEELVKAADQSKATLISLVPTQLYDLVQKRLQAPQTLRSVLIGGGALNDGLYQAACELGWPIVETYAMTECASQVAAATYESRSFSLLPHIQARLDKSGVLEIKSAALLTGRIVLRGNESILENPKIEEWYHTGDFARIQGECLFILGRCDQAVKINGELVHLQRLNNLIESLLNEHSSSGEGVLCALEDSRKGYQIAFVHTQDLNGLLPIIEKYQMQVSPFERIQKFKQVDAIPRNELGKILWSKLNTLLSHDNCGNAPK